MTVKVKSKTYKAKASTGKLAKNYSFKIGVTKAKGTVTYSKSKNCKKYITVNNKGKVSIKKGTPRGKYTINVKAKGKGTYASRTIKVSIKGKIKNIAIQERENFHGINNQKTDTA